MGKINLRDIFYDGRQVNLKYLNILEINVSFHDLMNN